MKKHKDAAIKRALSAAKRDRLALERQFKQRRCDLIDTLARSLPAGLHAERQISAEEGAVLHLRNLKAAKSVVRKIARRARQLSHAPPLQPQIIGEGEILRPSRIVAESHRPCVLPGLVTEHPDQSVMSVEEALVAGRNWISAGEAGYALLDHFQSTTGLDWEVAAEWLFREGLHPRRFDAGTLEMAKAARRFWTEWDACRGTYRAAVHLGQIPAKAGNWGLIDTDQVGALLPDFSPPRSAQRIEWLIRMVKKPSSSRLDLDFHAASYTPLFTVSL